MSTRRGSQASIFSFRPRNNSEADFADDEHSMHGGLFGDGGRSRASSVVASAVWAKRRTGSVRSRCSQALLATPSLNVNGRLSLNLSLDQNGVACLLPHTPTPTSLPACSMEKVKEDAEVCVLVC